MVIARYLTTYVLTVAGLVLWLAYAFVFAAILPDTTTGFEHVVSFKVPALYFFILSIYIALLLPAGFHFDTRTKTTVGITVAYVLFFISLFILIEALAARDIGFSDVVASMGRPLCLAMLVLLAFILNSASILLSARVYGQRDL